jgi:anthranilate synthase component 2
MKILVFDNYDSFTYNLVHYIEKIHGKRPDVFRNDEIQLDKINEYDKILLSPGPGLPKDAGILIPLIKQYYQKKDILGVCLGHQAIAEALGGELSHMGIVLHGVATRTIVLDKNNGLYRELPAEFKAGRYHSWQVSRKNLPDDLQITAIDEQDRIMSFKHKQYKLTGVQYHPESVLTEFGEKIIENWLKE